MTSHEQLLKALDEPVFEVDADGRVVFGTDALTAWTGRADTYAFAETLAPSDRARFDQMLKRVVEGKTKMGTLEVMLDAEAGALPVQIRMAPSQREGGRIARVAGWVRDTSYEKAQEAAANVQGAHLLDLIENVSDACVVENAEGEVEMVNVPFCELFRVEAAPQSLVGITCEELFAQAAGRTEKQAAPHYFARDSEERQEFDFRFDDGKHGRQYSMPVSSDDGVTGRLHIFRALEENAMAGAGSATIAAQSQMVEKIARDLATALESAGSAIHRAEQLDLPVAVIEHFRRVETSAQSAFSEIAGLLDFSQIESGDLKLESAEFALRESVATMLDRLVPLAEEREVQLRVSVEQDVPEYLTGDGPRLMLVLRSLMESGVPSAQNGGELVLVVEPEYTADRQIHLSFRIEVIPPKGGTRQKNLPATSLMQQSLARQIVRAMGVQAGVKGSSRIDTREKKETVTHQFTAVFPYRAHKDARARPTFVTLTGLPVLIVSNDVEQRKELAELARSWRMHPREADNAAVALQLLARMADEESPIPLIITSNQLPVQDGFVLSFRIKHQARLKQTAIMMLAKAGKPGDAIACRENGISAYLRHPIAANQLNEAISAVMGAQDDAEATATLITRHSLREAKAGSVLIVDPNREQAMVAIGALRKNDYRVVHTDTAEEAFAELEQDVFDVIIIDPMAKGFAELGIEGIPDRLRQRLARLPRIIPALLAVEDDVSAVEFGFSGTVKKPYEREPLVAQVANLVPSR